MSPPPPPPPSQLAHRRSRLNTDIYYPPSPPYSPDTSSCAARKMSLSKGATFHVSSLPPTEDSPVLSIPHLARRSPTGSKASFMSLLYEKEDGAVRSIQDFERTFSGARGKQRAHRHESDDFSGLRGSHLAKNLPSDEGIGSSTSTRTDKDLTRVFERALDLDSGLGSSIKTSSAKETRLQAGADTSDEEGPSAEELIQGWLARCVLMGTGVIDPQITGVVNKAPKTRQRSLATEAQSAIVRSISPMIPTSSRSPHLSSFARKKFADNILQPILREDRFKFFHPLVSSLGSRTNKIIQCLRDLEQSLIFEPLVSTIIGFSKYSHAYFSSLTSKKLAISHTLYRSFGEFSIQLVLDTYHHLSEPEQRRASDRPYDNGYFLDLVQQVGRLAAQVGAARRARSGEGAGAVDTDEMDYSPYVFTTDPSFIPISHHRRDDEVTLEGGLSQTGRPAELVRWKNGEGISLRTNEPYEAQPAIKRQRSNESLDDDAERSMARRKKNAEPKVIELHCSDRSCDKVFTRKCDLAKHEKTHSRPFKCPEKTCKYHEQGLPTEKERDRHINDKHSANPRYFHCRFCPFKTKRDSNCKQHMEKKHNWNYERVKGNSKATRTPQQTPQTPCISTPGISDDWGNNSTYGSDGTNLTPYTTSVDEYGDAPQDNVYNRSLFPVNRQPQTGDYGYGSPEFSFNSPYLAGIPEPATGSMGFTSPYFGQGFLDAPATPAHPAGPAFDVAPSRPLHIDIDYHGNYSGNLPTRGSHSLQPQSRNPSISETSPMALGDGLFPSAQQTGHPADTTFSNNYTGMVDLPNDDFALFSASGGPSMLSSTADMPAYEPMDMFSNMDTDYSDSQLGRYVNF